MGKSINQILSDYKGDRSDIIPILQDIQSNFGYLPDNMILEVSKFTGVPKSEIYGVATFYTQFRFTPIGRKHIMVCKGTACHVKGASRIMEGIERQLGIKEGEITPDHEYSLESVGCLGCCALAPCTMINENVESEITLRGLKKLFSKLRKDSRVSRS